MTTFKQFLEAEEKISKAGFMPFIVERGVPLYLFMVSSDTKFGGAKPQIAKGHVDEGETPKQAGVREAEEELGLRRSNIGTVLKGWSGTQAGLSETYPMTVFAARVKSKTAFDKPHYETEKTVWLSAEEFKAQGRKEQAAIVAAVDRTVKASLR